MYESNPLIKEKTVYTIYIGGGTPSILDIQMWKKLDEALFSKINMSDVKEWSLECNPESFSIEKGEMYADTGVTRLTFGVQSLNRRELSICGRAHSADRALETLNDSGLDGLFNSIGVDLIYSLPGQTPETLDNTLSKVFSVPIIKHLSAYELTIAQDTTFGRHSKRLPVPSEELSVQMYELIGKRCNRRGMRQYEISNYAMPGYESLHNKAYWSHKPYIGLGASAHSYIHPKRWSNAADAESYISKIFDGRSAVNFEETLGPLEIAAEMIFLGLRSEGGINEKEFAAHTGIEFYADGREKMLDEYSSSGFLEKRDGIWIPSPKGMLFADMMARGLIPRKKNHTA
jgi:oxygen-independent coproporphyrinogen-3 oxidase